MRHSPYSTLWDAWSATSSRMFDSVVEANRAALATFGVPGPVGVPNGDGTVPDARASNSDDPPRVEDRIGADDDLPEWDVEVEADPRLSVGDAVRFTKTLSEADVERFAAASGDTNPLHLDDERASETRFDGRIVHGTLAAGLISAALARLPGDVVYLSQDLEFRAPVRIGDRITADVEIVEDLGGERFRLRTTVEGDDGLVIDGEAVVLVE